MRSRMKPKLKPTNKATLKNKVENIPVDVGEAVTPSSMNTRDPKLHRPLKEPDETHK